MKIINKQRILETRKKFKKYFLNIVIKIGPFLSWLSSIKKKMDLNINKLWSIPIATAYLYAITVLMQYGYDSYFGIPSSFIESSVKDNIISSFEMTKLALAIASVLGWSLLWIFMVPVGLLITFRKTAISILGIVILIFGWWYAYDVGSFLAAHTTSFYVLSSDCENIGIYKPYIIPDFSNGKAILVSVDRETGKMKNGFIVRDIAELPCPIRTEGIGKITR